MNFGDQRERVGRESPTEPMTELSGYRRSDSESSGKVSVRKQREIGGTTGSDGKEVDGREVSNGGSVNNGGSNSPEKGTCERKKMAHPTSDSSEIKLERKDFRIDIQGKGNCQIEKMVCHAASTSDSTENKLEPKELHIDISGKVTSPIKKMATDIIEDIRTRNDELSIHIPQGWEPARWPECCIYKVPKKLRDVNEKAYDPKLISIGPLHHGQEELKDMELQKLKYFKEFFNRKGMSKKITLNKLASIIEENEEKIRHCYAADTSKFESKEFVNMILLDAIFIIELFLRNACLLERSKSTIHDLEAQVQTKNSEDATDHMFSEKWLSYNLKQELLLLENQLPFFILQELWEKSNCYSASDNHKEKKKNATDPEEKHAEEPSRKEDTSFLKHTFGYFYELLPKHKQEPSWKEIEEVIQQFSDPARPKKKVKHFTDMLRYFFYSLGLKKDGGCMEVKNFTDKDINSAIQLDESGVKFKKRGSIKHLYSATQLDEAGVKFKRNEHRPLLDIKFKKNLCLEYYPFLNCSWLLNCLPCFTCFEFLQPFLEVPTFEVNDETECVFRNLMAFEQCHSLSNPYICNYILLLDRLINSKEDVDLLVEEKVIVNFLGSNKRVATLVNNLCLEIVEPEHSPYDDLSERLDEHYHNYWNKNMASFTRLYFRDFWRGTATVVGLTVLVFTLWNYHRLLFRGQNSKGLKFL